MSVPLEALPLVDLLSLFAEQGECKYDPDLHTGPDAFEDESMAERLARTDAAKDICEDCPVWSACLEYALRTRPTSGIWAGYTPAELARLRTTARTSPMPKVA